MNAKSVLEVLNNKFLRLTYSESTVVNRTCHSIKRGNCLKLHVQSLSQESTGMLVGGGFTGLFFFLSF